MFNLSTSDCFTDKEWNLYEEWQECKKATKKKILRRKFEEKIAEFDGVRNIPRARLYSIDGVEKESKIIAGFENEFVRLSESFKYDNADPKMIPLIPEIVILNCYHYEILWQVIEKGVFIDGKKYIFYASSANQQKKRQVCLMEEDFFKKYEYRLMCGLTVDIINNSKEHGCNTGKYLAYTSLIFSKSVEPVIDINIDEVLVLPEFETQVFTKVNYLDMEIQEIEEKEMFVPVNHMDGAGFFIPGVLPQSAQIRGGWIKGCIFPFDFRQFIIEKQTNGSILSNTTIKDAWGEEVSIDYIRDNIKVILNTSQLKMWKYYNSWEEYKTAFKESELKICINNMMSHYPNSLEDAVVPSAYQFFQTIPRENVTEERIEKLCKPTIDKINDAKTNTKTALEIMGVDEEKDKELIPFFACIKQYPEMLHDPYVRSRISKKIKSERKKAMSGKPDIQGFYNYICPDLYAACEYWFCGENEPYGLVPANHVYNSFYNDKEKITEVCCLRSPHLSDCEHGIRKLIKSEKCKKWFLGMDTVISTHDLLTYTLVCDVDGDETLLTHDKAFIDMLDRNKFPLYYKMKKAEPTQVNKENISKCLKASFENSKIGMISNVLTKYLNLQEDIDLDFVRIITAYNNFCIDNPKSGYMPILRTEYEEIFEWMSAEDFPDFFRFAKDKTKGQCCSDEITNNRSNVNRISKHIEKETRDNKHNTWENKDEDKKKFNPQYFQSDVIKIDRSSKEYADLQRKIIELKNKDTDKYKKNLNKLYNEKNVELGYDVYYHYCNREIMDIMGANREKAAAYLLDVEYYQKSNQKKNKDILWNCFGDILYENLLKNLENPNKIEIKKMAYQKRTKRELDIEERIKKVAMKLEKEKQNSVSIYKDELDYINELSCRKNCEHDKYLLYILMVLYKRKELYLEKLKEQGDVVITDDNRKYFRIYRNSRYAKTTRNMIDKWIDKSVSKKGIERLLKKKLIKIEECKTKQYDYDKVYPQWVNFQHADDEKPAFIVKNRNPMFDYYLYTGEKKVGKCEVCGKLYIVVGNAKTCSNECSENLEFRNR